MKLAGDHLLVRIFLGESDRRDGVPLFEAIVQHARASGLAGATVLRGVEGFGAHSRIHRSSILRLSEDLPIVVELVDARDKIERFLEELDPWIDGGMVTVERVEVVIYRPRSGEGEPG